MAYGKGLVVTGRFFIRSMILVVIIVILVIFMICNRMKASVLLDLKTKSMKSVIILNVTRHMLLLNSDQVEMAAERRLQALQVCLHPPHSPPPYHHSQPHPHRPHLYLQDVLCLIFIFKMYSAPLLLVGEPPLLPSCLSQPLPMQINILGWAGDNNNDNDNHDHW